MTLEEYNGKIQDVIKNAGNQAELSIILDELRQDYSQQLKTIEETGVKVTTLTADNDALTKANGKLFLRLGEQATASAAKVPGTADESESKKLTFDDLYNEKGGLK